VIDHLRASPVQGLQVWMEKICSEFEQASGLLVERACEAGLPELSQEVQSQLMRVVQEALTNIRKHANASRVKVVLREWQGDMWLEVQDNGEGFLPDDVPFQSRHGLRGMQERAELMGADFQIFSQPGEGTMVRLRLPGEVEEKNR
jgi:two-component system nitrate/nitrite sensor histidine kinase NarX